MKINRLIVYATLFCGAAAVAHARSNPTPPPSGIVIHLFGPTGVMNSVAPDLLGDAVRPAPARQTPASGSPQAAGGLPDGNQPPGASAPAGAAQTTDYPEPTMHDVLHQMFVTGDPDHPNQPSIGRDAGHRVSD